MRLVWVVIPLVFFGIIGISNIDARCLPDEPCTGPPGPLITESFDNQVIGNSNWETNSNKVCGDKLCSEIIDEQNILSNYTLGKLQWIEISYPLNGKGTIQVIDSDMNFDSSVVEIFQIDVWSDTDSQGIQLFVIQTSQSSGIFEGEVLFSLEDSSKEQLKVTNGDTISARYQDKTLPESYLPQKELEIIDVTLAGTIVPPVGYRGPSNLRVVDMVGNSLDTVNVYQQIHISSDFPNSQDREQPFTFFIQIQDVNGITVSLDWVTGSINPGQSVSSTISWSPTKGGSYAATAFYWESIENPTILSPPMATTITVID